MTYPKKIIVGWNGRDGYFEIPSQDCGDCEECNPAPSRFHSFLLRTAIAVGLAVPILLPVVDRVLHAFGICIGH